MFLLEFLPGMLSVNSKKYCQGRMLVYNNKNKYLEDKFRLISLESRNEHQPFNLVIFPLLVQMTFSQNSCCCHFHWYILVLKRRHLMLSMLGQIFSRCHPEFFFLTFPQKIDVDISCKLFNGDNLHEISSPVFCLVCLVKFSAGDILKYIFLFSQKTRFDDSCKLARSNGDNLHEMSNPIFCLAAG